MKKIIFVSGARPNFMKIAPVLREINLNYKNAIIPIIVHTGQHYDQNMSISFFENLGIKDPEYNFNVGSGTHADQTAKIMSQFEDVCEQENPDIVVVVGDVNSTIAAAIVTKKLNKQLAHIEAGLRSRDRTMPEEINRLATDAITDIFFVTEINGLDNLIQEGHERKDVHFVGNVMIDNLFYQLGKLEKTGSSLLVEEIRKTISSKYACITLHRPSNVDSPTVLSNLVDTCAEVAQEMPIIFPCHPRTKKQLEKYGLIDKCKNVFIMTEPLGYNDFLSLWKDASVVYTDSGGLQEETTALGIPCLTLRYNTERPSTVDIGTNTLVGNEKETILKYTKQVLDGCYKKGSAPEFWDGKASERICKILKYHIK